MLNPADDFERLLRTESRAKLRHEVLRRPHALPLPQAQRVIAHCAALLPPLRPLRVAVIHTYTSELLDPWLNLAAALEGYELQVHHAPYGLALQEAEPNSPLLSHKPDITLFMLQRTDLHPDLSRPLAALAAGERQRLAEACLQRLQEIVLLFRAQAVGQILLTLLPPPAAAALGLFDAQSEASERAWWAGFEAEVGRWLRQAVASSLLLDLSDVMQQVGRRHFFDSRYWYASRFPFTASAAFELARRVVAIGAVLLEPRAKVIVLDADNTLWGGVIGEDGIDGIALGPDHPGNAFVDFQRRLLDFQQRGFVLAMCSKNNPADVDQVLGEHPHQLLRESHFAARRVNWLPKPDNLVSLAEELNLGLDSFIFVDDSDHECAAVRHRLPQVQVVQVPARAVDVPSCLDLISRLEVLSLTDEDRAKTALYAQERQRRDLLQGVSSTGSGAGDYLTRLGMRMRVSLDEPAHLARLSQLSKKSNQFNLSTRRYDEHQVQAFMSAGEWIVADFSLADVFGDSGIVGLALLRLDAPGRAEIDTFLMSCRVIGRQAESAFLESLLRHLEASGVGEVVADYLPTAKNVLVQNFLAEHGFEATASGRWQRRLSDRPPRAESEFPIGVDWRGSTSTPSA